MRVFDTVTVEVSRPGETTTDAHGNAVVGERKAETVSGVLPAPGATSDLDAARPDGAKVDMTFHFPKAYTASLKGCLVTYGGRVFKVVGDPQPYVCGNVPGEWGRAVECEACDG